jgi:hypothetical protein
MDDQGDSTLILARMGVGPLQFFLAVMMIAALLVCALMQEREQAMR